MRLPTSRFARRRELLVVLLSALFVILPAAASATLSGLVQASAPSPFSAACNGNLAGNVQNAEVEPWVVVSPLDQRHVVAAWQQDRWGDPNEGGAHGLLAWSSADGGATGVRSFAPFTTCSGGIAANHGDYDRASDVWLSYGPDGALYQAALVFDWFTGRNAVTVSKSIDNGATWGTPVVVDASSRTSFTHGDDKESVTADPSRPGYVYVVWDRYSAQNPAFSDGHGQNANKGPAYFSRSTDGGKTWSDPAAIYAKNNGTLGNQILVLPNGTLADFFVEYIATNNPKKGGVTWSVRLSEIQSKDHGLTWSSTPTVVSQMDFQGVTDPDTGALIRDASGLFDVAVDPGSGTLYAVWQDRRFTGVDQVALSRSTDGGATWSAPVRVDRTPANTNPLDTQAFTPSVDVGSGGAVAITYYDFRNNVDTSTTTGTDYWGDVFTPNLALASETRLTPSSFDARLAPSAGGPMIGDYEGLTHAGSTFIAAFETTGAGATDPTDIQIATFG